MEFLTKALDIYDGADIEANGDLDCIDDNELLAAGNGDRLQHENAYNKLLPYDISEERQEHLMRIKASLAECIQLDQETVYEWFIELER